MLQKDRDIIADRGYIIRDESELLEDEQPIKFALKDREGHTENIWGLPLQEVGDRVKLLLLNHAIAFMPNHSWGLVIQGVKGADGRVSASFDEQDHEAISQVYEEYRKEFPDES